MRKIIHVDMDAFYASIEQRDRPEWKGKPLVVGGDPEGRGVVASASYEARKFGVRSAMSSSQAKRLCPRAIFVYPDFTRYVEASRKIREIFLSVTPLVEPLSLDEAYLDVTENLLDEPLASRIARHIKDRIKTKLRLTASAGVGPNKFIAKVASDLKKPDGLVVIPPNHVAAFVEKLPVEKLWGVGPATTEKLHSAGLKTTADIRSKTEAQMVALLGSFGSFLHGLAHGEDSRPVEPEREPKSSGSERTFERDILDLWALESKLQELSEEVATELRKIGRPGRTVTLKLRYSDFETITRSKTITQFLDSPESIARIAIALLRGNTEAGSRPVRLIGVSVSGLRNENDPEQLYFQFPPPFDLDF